MIELEERPAVASLIEAPSARATGLDASASVLDITSALAEIRGCALRAALVECGFAFDSAAFEVPHRAGPLKNSRQSIHRPSLHAPLLIEYASSLLSDRLPPAIGASFVRPVLAFLVDNVASLPQALRKDVASLAPGVAVLLERCVGQLRRVETNALLRDLRRLLEIGVLAQVLRRSPKSRGNTAAWASLHREVLFAGLPRLRDGRLTVADVLQRAGAATRGEYIDEKAARKALQPCLAAMTPLLKYSQLALGTEDRQNLLKGWRQLSGADETACEIAVLHSLASTTLASHDHWLAIRRELQSARCSLQQLLQRLVAGSGGAGAATALRYLEALLAVCVGLVHHNRRATFIGRACADLDELLKQLAMTAKCLRELRAPGAEWWVPLTRATIEALQPGIAARCALGRVLSICAQVPALDSHMMACRSAAISACGDDHGLA